MNTRSFLSVALAGLLCLSLAGCGEKPTTRPDSKASSSQEPTYQVNVVLPNGVAQAEAVLAGVDAAASASGLEVEVVAHQVADAKEELEQLQKLGADSTTGLVVMPVGGEVALAELSRIAGRGNTIAVVGVDAAAVDFTNLARSMDSYAMGEQMGQQAKQYITDQLAGKASVAVVGHSSQNRAESLLRVNGFLDQLEGMADITLTADLDVSDPSLAEEQLRTFFESNAAVDVVFCTTDETAAEAAKAAVAAGSKAVIYCADAGEQTIQALQSGETPIQAAAAQDYYSLGEWAAQSVLEKIASSSTPDHDGQGVLLLTAEDSSAIAAFASNNRLSGDGTGSSDEALSTPEDASAGSEPSESTKG